MNPTMNGNVSFDDLVDFDLAFFKATDDESSVSGVMSCPKCEGKASQRYICEPCDGKYTVGECVKKFEVDGITACLNKDEEALAKGKKDAAGKDPGMSLAIESIVDVTSLNPLEFRDAFWVLPGFDKKKSAATNAKTGVKFAHVAAALGQQGQAVVGTQTRHGIVRKMALVPIALEDGRWVMRAHSFWFNGVVRNVADLSPNHFNLIPTALNEKAIEGATEVFEYLSDEIDRSKNVNQVEASLIEALKAKATGGEVKAVVTVDAKAVEEEDPVSIFHSAALKLQAKGKTKKRNLKAVGKKAKAA